MDNNRIFSGKWICAPITVDDRCAPVFKKEIIIKNGLTEAKAFVCGLGLFELRINGAVADDSVLNPANTQYTKTVLYREFDITHLLVVGKNIITIELGNGFYNETVATWKWDTAAWRDIPKLFADIELSYCNKKEIVSSDEGWLVSVDGPIVSNSIYYGEIKDLRKTPESFQPSLLAEAPKGEIKKQAMPPIRRIEEFKALNVTDLGNNSYIIEAPQMVTGWARFDLCIPMGEKMTVTYGEALLPDGQVVHIGENMGRDGNWFPKATIQQDVFIGNGKREILEPKFSYKGFRYIQVDNCPEKPDNSNTTIYRVANDLELVSEFECSEPLVNRLHSVMKSTLLNNFQGKPTDTPVWEKNGWLGDASCGLLSMLYNFNMHSFLSEFVNTMKDCFAEYGVVPVMVPTADWGVENSPVWNTVFVHAAEEIYNFYGDKELLEELYPYLKEFAYKDVEDIEAKGGVWNEKGLSDWVAPVGRAELEAQGNSSEGAEICATAFIYNMLKAMVRIARILNKSEDIDFYRESGEKIKNAFDKAFFNTEKGYYETTFWKQIGERKKDYRQTSNLLPLAFGMVAPENKERVVKNLVEDIKSKGNHLDTGCTGTRFLLPVLFDNGEDELAFSLLTQKTYPSWGYWLEKGSDSLWESWEDTTRSRNHYFLGSYEEALFTHILGIKNVRNGFREFDFCPHTDCGLSFARGKVKTPYGYVECSWEKSSDGNVKVSITAPPQVSVNVI